MRRSKAAGVGKAASGGIFDDDSSSSPEDDRKPGRSSTSGRGRLLKVHSSAKAAMPPLGATERQGSKAGGPSTARGAPPPRGRASTPGRHLLRRASPARSRSPRPAAVAAPALAAAPAAVPSTPTNGGRRATILTTNSGRLTLASIGLLSRTTNTPLRSKATPQQSPAAPTPAAEGFRPSAIIRRPSLPAGLQKQNLHLARLLVSEQALRPSSRDAKGPRKDGWELRGLRKAECAACGPITSGRRAAGELGAGRGEPQPQEGGAGPEAGGAHDQAGQGHGVAPAGGAQGVWGGWGWAG